MAASLRPPVAFLNMFSAPGGTADGGPRTRPVPRDPCAIFSEPLTI